VRGLLIRVAIIAVIGLGAFVLRDRISGSASDLAVGDCFAVPTEEAIRDVDHHPCTEAHDAEVVYVGDHPAPDDAAPLTDDGLQDFVMNTCGGAMIEYVGGLQALETNAELENLDLGVIYPTDDDWNGGERKITCYLHSVDGSELTKSYKAAA
jgi:hypothetical protein